MADGDVDVRGFRELGIGIARLSGNIGDEADRRFLGVADRVAQDVRVQQPRHSGRLAGSVASDHGPDGARVGMGGPDVPYAAWIEFGGTRRGRGGGIASRPFVQRGRSLMPTATDATPTLLAEGERAANNEIRGFTWPMVK